MKKISLLMAILLLVVSIAGCGQSSSGSADKNILRYALEAEPATIDPGLSTAIPASNVELQLFEGLTRLDDKGQPQPGAAVSWTVNPEGTEYTFTLREGAVWSDGTPVKASDFEYAWKRILDPKTGSQNAYMLYALKNGQAFYEGKASAADVGVKAVDDRTLKVNLETPVAYFLGLTAFHAYYPVPQHVVEKAPQTWASDASSFVGNGPFILSNWAHKTEMVFAKNPKYWDAVNVKLAGMQWPISESQKTRLTLVENNQADMMVEPPMVDQQRLTDKGIFHIAPYLGTYYYVFNVEAAPLTDVRVRQALSMAIYRENIVQNIVKGGKTPANAFVSNGLLDPVTQKDFREEGGNLVTENVAQAKALLAAAGYGPQNPLPTVTILYNTNEMHKAVAEAIQAIWKQELGVDSELVNQETKVYFDTRSSGNFQIAKSSWIADYSDPQTFLDVFFDPDNDARYHSAEYNALMEKVHNTADQQTRMSTMHEAEKVLFRDAVVIPIYFTTQPYVATDRIGGYSWSNLGTVDFKSAFVKDGQ